MAVSDAGSSGALPALTILTEAELAAMRHEEGSRVVEVDGRHWLETFRGFYQPIHQLALHRRDSIRRPTLGCWGYRAMLAPQDVATANGAYPVHVMRGLGSFTMRTFEESRRRDLRRSRRVAQMVVGSDIAPFLDDAWDVYRSAKERVPAGGTLTRAQYIPDFERRIHDPRRLLVGGLIDGRLAGYMEAYAVDEILYGRDLWVATPHVNTGLATGLYFEVIQAGAQSGLVQTLCLGPELRERPGLAFFKKTMGVPVERIPMRVVIPAPIRAVMRTMRPAAYYRITGLEPATASLPAPDGEAPG